MATLALALALTACGERDPNAEATRTATAAGFPEPGSFKLTELTQAPSDGRPQLAPSVSVLRPGTNRFGFVLFDAGGDQVEAPAAAVYTASPSGTDVRGPYPARVESLRVRAPFASKTTVDDSDMGPFVHVASVPFPRRGKFVAIAVSRAGDRLVASLPAEVEVGGPQPVAVGAPAPRVSTPTVESVGDVSAIETRIPPDDMHRDDLADVLGVKPVVLVFATPRLCQQRVCAPVVDAAAQLQAQYGDRAVFIHMEVYRDNEVQKGLRPQLKAFGLRTEPWVFTIDRRGRVAARLESAASVKEIRAAVERALR